MSGSGFDIEFEEDVLAKCLRDTEFLKESARLMDAHHFASKHMGWVWKVTKETWLSFAERPTAKVMMAAAKREFPDADERRPFLEVTSKLFKHEPKHARASLAEVQRFVRFVRMQTAMEKAVVATEKGNVDEAYEALRKLTLHDVRPRAFKSIDWIEEFDDRQRDRKHKREHPEEYKIIPTGIRKLDGILGGGMHAPKVGLVMATTGVGKSIFLTNLGFAAVMRDFYVVHFSLEMPAEPVATRYDARFTKVMYDKFKGFDFTASELREIDARVAKNKERFKGHLKIISMPLRRADIGAVRNALDEARIDMPRVDMVVMDSGDHLKGMGKFESHRLEQAEVYWDMKALAEEDDYVIWSSTHAGREWAKRTATAEASSESYDKSRIADLVFTINQPKDAKRRTTAMVVDDDEDATVEVDDDEPEEGKANLEGFLAKNRDGLSKVSIPLEADLARMLIKEAE
jgi:replicative DNA helicase